MTSIVQQAWTQSATRLRLKRNVRQFATKELRIAAHAGPRQVLPTDRGPPIHHSPGSYNARMTKAGRNDSCPCGSGRKFKKCCANRQQRSTTSLLLIGILVAALAGGIYAAVVGFGDEGSTTAAPGRVWSAEHGHYH